LNQPISKSSLSEPERRLVDLFQEINFGRLEALRIRAGVPLLQPAPRVIQTLKMGGQNGPREEAALPDFWLKQPLIDLIQTIRQIEDGEILSIEVKHGLPFVVEIERSPR
jgi:hypothetical protein